MESNNPGLSGGSKPGVGGFLHRGDRVRNAGLRGREGLELDEPRRDRRPWGVHAEFAACVIVPRIGVSKGSVSDWERGNWAPEDPHLWRLAMVFGVPVGVLAAPDPPEELVPGDLGDDVIVPEERAEGTTSQKSER